MRVAIQQLNGPVLKLLNSTIGQQSSQYLLIESWVEQLNISIQRVSGECSQLETPQTFLSLCAALPSSSPSGYYWITHLMNNSAVRVYCDMTLSCGNITGGWMRVAELNMSDNNQQCPNELQQQNHSSIRTCVRPNEPGGQTSLNFSSNAVSYSKVCGKVRAYQSGYADAFRTYHDSGRTLGLDDYFVNGVVLTHGSPRQHIWTFVCVRDEIISHYYSDCYPCLVRSYGQPSQPPPFIGNDYFCDSGSRDHFINGMFYGDDPLWDGAGCESPRDFPLNTCCSFNNPPWFFKQLSQPTTDAVEMRMMQSSTAVQVHSFELYVQ